MRINLHAGKKVLISTWAVEDVKVKTNSQKFSNFEYMTIYFTRRVWTLKSTLQKIHTNKKPSQVVHPFRSTTKPSTQNSGLSFHFYSPDGSCNFSTRDWMDSDICRNVDFFASMSECHFIQRSKESKGCVVLTEHETVNEALLP